VITLAAQPAEKSTFEQLAVEWAARARRSLKRITESRYSHDRLA
jgi:hypothetical protein